MYNMYIYIIYTYIKETKEDLKLYINRHKKPHITFYSCLWHLAINLTFRCWSRAKISKKYAKDPIKEKIPKLLYEYFQYAHIS